MNEPHYCDICSTPLAKADGYAFNTTQVARSIAYWRYMVERQRSNTPSQLADGGAKLGLFVNAILDNETPWIVCEGCSRLVNADRATAKEAAARGRKPRGCGPVRGADRTFCGLSAAYGYSLVFDEWPKFMEIGESPITHEPSVGVRCDFCCRRVYGEEKFALLNEHGYKDLCQKGAKFVRDPAPGHEKGGETFWMACEICIERATGTASGELQVVSHPGNQGRRPWWKFW